MVATSIPATPPEPVMIERFTRGNRHLWYRLEVVQQPERARACGAGPKSSADRRPVDPPPVVELRIFEGPSIEHAKDVTFTYNANFFLFATLEHARVIAHGRIQAPSAATPPVLTGMPVSGMAYLDRPQEAGYFLFPDLSVRHEGRYRLTFNLYEQTKETCDLDKPSADYKMPIDMPESFDWRMEVKSNDFTVYSAKKFPGLTESNALSRTVAEQGCRVRIRRDVRMRRREGKSAAAAAVAAAAAAVSGANDREDEYRRHRTQTPEVNDYRARSMSQESVNRTPYGPSDAQRRPSMGDYHHAAPSPQPGPSMPPAFGASSSTPTPNANHLRFGGAPTSYGAPSSVPPSPTYPSSHASYAQPPPPPPQPQHHHSGSTYSAAPSPVSQPPPSQSPYYQDRPASQHYSNGAPSPAPGPAPPSRRESLSSSLDYHRRMSNSYVPAESMDRRPDMGLPRSLPENKTTLPPLSEMIASFGNKDQPQPPRPMGNAPVNSNPHNHHLGSYSSSSSSNNNSNSSSSSAPTSSSDRVPSLSQLLLPQPVLPAPSASKKRTYGQYNNLDAASEAYQMGMAMKNHARQPEIVVSPQDEDELWWKRADGTVWSARGDQQLV